jgi:hypothetical protein
MDLAHIYLKFLIYSKISIAFIREFFKDMDDSSSFDDEDDDVDILSQFSSSDVSAMTIEDDDNSANIVMNFNSSPRNTY